jgi:hypothetical protein
MGQQSGAPPCVPLTHTDWREQRQIERDQRREMYRRARARRSAMPEHREAQETYQFALEGQHALESQLEYQLSQVEKATAGGHIEHAEQVMREAEQTAEVLVKQRKLVAACRRHMKRCQAEAVEPAGHAATVTCSRIRVPTLVRSREHRAPASRRATTSRCSSGSSDDPGPGSSSLGRPSPIRACKAVGSC